MSRNPIVQVLLLLFLTLGLRIQATPIEATHPVYPFLRRLEVRGVIDRPFLGSLPFPRTEILDLLRQAQADSSNLGLREKKDLDRYLAEFDPEIHARSSRLVYHDAGRTLSGSLKYFAGGYYQDSLPEATAISFTSLTPHIEGSLSNKLSFVSEASVGSESSRHRSFLLNYDPQRGLPFNTRTRVDSGGNIPKVLDNALTFDAFRTVFSWRGNGLGIEAGNDWNQWGPGTWQHPTFATHAWFWVNDSLPAVDTAGFTGSYVPGGSRLGFRAPGESAPLTQVRMDFTWHALKYTKFLAEKIGLTTKTPAHIVAHRLEVRLGKNLLVGAHEIIAYSGRSFELTYAIPLVPLKFAEHQVGDLDNVGLGFDLDYRLPGGMRIYSELFLDDLHGPLELLDEWWGNKYAFLIGGEAYNLFSPASSVQVEYARVEPWVYGHHTPNNQMQHYGSLLGSRLPPNSQAVWLRWSQMLPKGLTADMEYAFLQRQLHSRGSSIFDFHVDSTDGYAKVFLGENPETRNALRMSVSAGYGRYILGKIMLGYMQVDAWKNDPLTELSGPTGSLEVTLAY